MAGYWLPTDPVEDMPSMQVGFAAGADDSDAPWQWEGLVLALAPFLGIQGGTLYDLSGHGNHGTLTGFTLASAWSAGQRGVQLNSDAVDSYVSVADSSTLDVIDNFTLMAWVKLVVSPPNEAELFEKGTNAYEVDIVSGGTSLRFNKDNTAVLISATYPNDGAWHRVVVTKAGSSLALYVDAVQTTATNATALAVTTTVLAIGADIFGGVDKVVDGALDDIRVYQNRVWSAAEVIEDYLDPYAMYRLRRRRLWAVTAVVVSEIELMSSRQLMVFP